MVFKVNDKLPEDCALRRGTLIAGVQKPTRSDPSRQDDPMQPAVDQIERALYSAVTGRVTEQHGPEPASARSESTTRNSSEKR